ncbi:Gfo/Idh/MocA family oxidoreductase [Roseomonas gilardii subsp. gilardii]|uniref:Gfo/Idh/MocA family protein n=1 Tax=Roseomonas gilardii TaxID=257708 RepID=UPI001FFBFC75|nr:Gfo/Idh/MocA family oxidoreductase [Roseomonas gilardii]UPG71910.1 Gfo/Idh/MocA family oxidoreductase [Roseomonas gilardii subsp. gilardii]
MEQVRIAVAGAGLIGRRHIEEIVRSQGAVLSAIIDPSPAAREIADREGVPLYPSLRDCFAHDRPDGVVLATPNQMHVAQGLECVAARVPVLVEKPIGHRPDEALRLVEAAEQAGIPLLVGHHRPHSPILRKAVEVVRSGILGRLVGVIGSAVFYKPDADGYYDGPFAWRREPGGGPVLINMIHEVGNLRAMIGEIVAVQALASNATRNFAVEDTVAINLRFANGALGTFMLSDTAASPKSWEQTSRENAAYPTYPEEDAYTILGTDGSLAVPTMRLKYYARKEDRSWHKPFREEVLPVERTDPLARQIEHFAAVIRGEEAPLVTGRDGLRNLRVTDAILEAARSGGTVSLSG